MLLAGVETAGLGLEISPNSVAGAPGATRRRHATRAFASRGQPDPSSAAKVRPGQPCAGRRVPIPAFSDWLEGKPILRIEKGCLTLHNLNHLNLKQKALFGKLRQQQVEHLGQVRRAYMEATGQLSTYFYAPDEAAPGLPIWPERLAASQRRAETPGAHACCRCGHVQTLARGEARACPMCRNPAWVPACAARREA